MPHPEKSRRGGARPNAGRKKGSSAYGESTQAMRIPESLIPKVKTMLELRRQPSAQTA